MSPQDAYIPSGLGATSGWAEESAPGTYVSSGYRWVMINSDKVIGDKTTVTSRAINQSRVQTANRRRVTRFMAAGDVEMDVVDRQMGLLFKHALGSVPAVYTVGTGAYTQVHTLGDPAGYSLSHQVGKTTTLGALVPFSYPGEKVASWTLDVEVGALAKWTMSMDALGPEFDPTYVAPSYISPTPNVLAAVDAVLLLGGTVTSTTTESGCSGSTTAITLGGSNTAIVPGMLVTVTSGTGAFTAGTYVTAVSGTSLTVSANPSTTLSAATIAFSGVATVASGAAPLATVKSVSIKCDNKIATDRQNIGTTVRREQIPNDFADITGEMAVEFAGTADFWTAWQGDTRLALQLTLTGSQIASSGVNASLQVTLPDVQWDKSVTPEVPGPEILTVTIPFTCLNDLVNPVVQFLYTTADSAY